MGECDGMRCMRMNQIDPFRPNDFRERSGRPNRDLAAHRQFNRLHALLITHHLCQRRAARRHHHDLVPEGGEAARQ